MSALVLAATATRAAADEPGPALLRYEDPNAEWASHCPDDGRGASCLKWMPTGSVGTRWSLGGETRWRAERTQGLAFEETPPETAFLQRYSVYADLRLATGLRLFSQAGSAFENGRSGGPSPVDENRLWLQNAFAQVGDPTAGWQARLGRQELRFGSARLVDVREGPNVRRTFDALRVTRFAGLGQVDLLAARAVKARTGALDDYAGTDSAVLWGVYAVVPAAGASTLDLYYLGHRDKQAVWLDQVLDERRHSLGARWWGRNRDWSWNMESVYQFGRADSLRIEAWTFAAIIGRDLPGRWRPHAALSANVASGDGDAADGKLGLFNPLYPRGNYFSEDATLGPRNFYNLNPSITLLPRAGVAVSLGVNAFWRQSTDDGVYAPSGALLRAPAGSRARYVGTFASLGTEVELGAGWQIGLSAAYGRPGRFIEESGAATSIRFVEATLAWRF